MVQTEHNKKPAPQRYGRTSAASPKTVIIVYDQPKVFVVRHYTKTIIPRVNPVQYEKQFHRVLLDTSTLLSLTRRLNIQDSQITPPKPR